MHKNIFVLRHRVPSYATDQSYGITEQFLPSEVDMPRKTVQHYNALWDFEQILNKDIRTGRLKGH